jgi:hypothetical protein
MNSIEFSTQFSPWDSGLCKTVVDALFKANESVADVTVELYKLNVYGMGFEQFVYGRLANSGVRRRMFL